MGGFFAKLFGGVKVKECKVLMLGLDGAGKTTILYNMKSGNVIDTIPTIGFNVETLKFDKVQFMVWDVGGQSKIRALWKHYYEKSKGIIYVVDSSDEERIGLACKQLKYVLSSPLLQDAVLLVLANKRDIARNSLESFTEQMDLNKLTRHWAVYPVTAIKKDNGGLKQAFQWLVSSLNTSKKEVSLEPR